MQELFYKKNKEVRKWNILLSKKWRNLKDVRSDI